MVEEVMMEIIIVYIVGFILSMIGIYIADRVVSPNAAKTDLDASLIMSLFSWMTVLVILFAFTINSNIYMSVDKWWRK